MKAVRSGAPCKHELLHFLGKGILIRTHMYMYIYIHVYDVYMLHTYISFLSNAACSNLSSFLNSRFRTSQSNTRRIVGCHG